jgi:hypothetical protein
MTMVMKQLLCAVEYRYKTVVKRNSEEGEENVTKDLFGIRASSSGVLATQKILQWQGDVDELLLRKNEIRGVLKNDGC